jgi:transposase InsO family protein
MKRLKLTRARRERFLKVLADTGNVTAAVAAAGTSRTRVYELRKTDPAFAASWEEAEEIVADALEAEVRRRAVEGVEEPLVSAGRIVRDDNGQPIGVRRYSDKLLLELLKKRRPPRTKGRCASNCRHFDALLMQPAQWQRSPPRLPLAT